MDILVFSNPAYLFNEIYHIYEYIKYVEELDAHPANNGASASIPQFYYSAESEGIFCRIEMMIRQSSMVVLNAKRELN